MLEEVWLNVTPDERLTQCDLFAIIIYYFFLFKLFISKKQRLLNKHRKKNMMPVFIVGLIICKDLKIVVE